MSADQRHVPSGWERPRAIGPWVCIANGVIAVVLLAWLATTLPELAETEALYEHPWLDHWMRATAVVALLLPASTLFLYRSCPMVPIPRERWPKGDATPLRQRVLRLAPAGAKHAIVGMAVHGVALVSLPVVAVVAAGGL